MLTNFTYEFCDWSNLTHTTAFLDLLNHYMLDPMGNHAPLSKEEQIKLIKGLKDHPSAEVLLMKNENDYVAMTTVFTNFSTFNIQPYFYIHDVVVVPVRLDDDLAFNCSISVTWNTTRRCGPRPGVVVRCCERLGSVAVA